MSGLSCLILAIFGKSLEKIGKYLFKWLILDIFLEEVYQKIIKWKNIYSNDSTRTKIQGKGYFYATLCSKQKHLECPIIFVSAKGLNLDFPQKVYRNIHNWSHW